MKVDYQKEIVPSVYKFRPIHLKWSGLHISAGAMLIYMVASRLPDGKTPTNLFVVSIIGLIVFAVNGMLNILTNSNSGKSLSASYTFTRKYRDIFVKMIAGCLFLAAVLCFFIPPIYWNLGIGVCGISVFCLWRGTKMSPSAESQVYKEPLTALLYTAGIWGGIWLSTDLAFRDTVTLGVTFLLITFQLLLLISHFSALDRASAPNLARGLGKAKTSKIIYCCTIVVVLLSISACVGTEFRYVQRIAVIFAGMGTLNALIFFKSSTTSHQKHWWLLAEFTGLIPLLLL